MKLWHVADYFKVPLLLDIITRMRDKHANALVPWWCTPTFSRCTPTFSHKHFDRPLTFIAPEQVSKAIDRLIDYDNEGKLHIVSKFRSIILRLFLSYRYEFLDSHDTVNDRNKRFFQDWESLVNKERQRPVLKNLFEFAPLRCSKCRVDEVNVRHYREPMGLDSIKWYTDHRVNVLCVNCNELPTLATLEIVRDLENLEQERLHLEEERLQCVKKLEDIDDRLLATKNRLYNCP